MKHIRDQVPFVKEIIDGGLSKEGGEVFAKEDMFHHTLHIRWASLQSDTIIREFHQILSLVHHVGCVNDEGRYIYNKMERLISWLEQRKIDSMYIEVLLVVRKYLDGMKKFLSKHLLDGLATYQLLFEGVFIAIIHETRWINGEFI